MWKRQCTTTVLFALRWNFKTRNYFVMFIHVIYQYEMFYVNNIINHPFLQFLFDTMSDISVLPCGHTIHLECVKEMEQRLQLVHLFFLLHKILFVLYDHLNELPKPLLCICRYTCPVCSKSYCDMSSVWEKLDHEVRTLIN